MAIYSFDFIENLCTCFSEVTIKDINYSKNILPALLGQTYSAKKLSDNRWSCRADVTKALENDYLAILQTLNLIPVDAGEKDHEHQY